MLPSKQTDVCTHHALQAGVDVSKHGGHAYPGMENVYDSELKGLDVTSDDVTSHKTFQGSSGIDYSMGGSTLQRQVCLA